MTHSTTSRVSPQSGPFSGSTKPSDQSSSLEDESNDGVVRVVSNVRIQCPYPAAKAWVSEAVPSAAPGSSDDLCVPTTATFHYRQRRDFADEGVTSVLVAWLAALLCMPRLGSGRLRSPTSRRDSVDSVDFVSTWQKAQAEAAARRVVPVLKRANELTPPARNTPGSSMSELAPVGGPVSVHGSLTVGQTDGRSPSYVLGTQRPPSCCQLPSSCAASGDLVPFVSGDLPLRPPSSRASSRPESRQVPSGQISKRSVRFG